MIHALNSGGTIAAAAHLPEYPWMCGHEIPRDRGQCECGARRAVIAVPFQPVLQS